MFGCGFKSFNRLTLAVTLFAKIFLLLQKQVMGSLLRLYQLGLLFNLAFEALQLITELPDFCVFARYSVSEVF